MNKLNAGWISFDCHDPTLKESGLGCEAIPRMAGTS
jgi:hypothetical protein